MVELAATIFVCMIGLMVGTWVLVAAGAIVVALARLVLSVVSIPFVALGALFDAVRAKMPKPPLPDPPARVIELDKQRAERQARADAAREAYWLLWKHILPPEEWERLWAEVRTTPADPSWWLDGRRDTKVRDRWEVWRPAR